MTEEINEILDKAIEREIYSQSIYLAGEVSTDDQAARKLMAELAAEELEHVAHLRKIKREGFKPSPSTSRRIADLEIDRYLEGGGKLENAGVHDTLIFAIKHEQESIDFYSRLMGLAGDERAKKLCEMLVQEELEHKMRLEEMYDDMVFMED